MIAAPLTRHGAATPASSGPKPRRTLRVWALLSTLALVAVWSWAPWEDSVEPRRAVAPRSPERATPQRSTTVPQNALRPVLTEQAMGHLFATARPAPAPLATAPLPAPPPEPPPLPQATVAVRGMVRQAGEPLKALVETPDGQLRAVAVGDLAQPDWAVRALNGRELLIEHIPTQTQRALPVPSES